MTLRTKVSLVVILDILLTVTIVGVLAFRQSKAEIESLARDLLRARTEYAFALCDKYNDLHSHPMAQLQELIRQVRIARDGYISVLSNAPASKGVLVIHPTDVGVSLNTSEFPHIQQILRQIDAAGGTNGFGKFVRYRQRTEARGRQGEYKIGYYLYFAPWQWILLSTGYEKDVYGSTDTVRVRVVQAILIVGLLALVVINLALWQMFRPMQALILATEAVAAGNLDTSIHIESKDEIGGLAAHFNNMLLGLKENTRVWQELAIARRLQTEMLPAGHPQLPGVQIEARSMPAAEVGGDFYDFIPLDEDRFGLIIGDVSGKGISGAMGMSSAMSALRFAADMRDSTDEILALANRRLVQDMQKSKFVAVFLAIYDRARHQLSYTNAGQTMPYLVRNGTVQMLGQSAADRFPLGIRSNVTYIEQSVELAAGDLLVCYTDGIVELPNGQREPYGFERFQASIAASAGKALPEMLATLIDDARAYIDSENYMDDITIVLVKVN